MFRIFSIAILAASLMATVSPAVPTRGTPPSNVTALPSNEVARMLGNAFAGVAEKVSPSVVIVTVTRKGGEGEGFSWGPEEQQPEPFDFFRKMPRRPAAPQPREPVESQGSGFIVRADGYIYTNNHVIQGASKIKVRLKDGRVFDAQVVGVPDEKTDVAVIKIDAKDLPVVEIGDSDNIRPGEWTIAIGAPFSLDYSITVGVLSGKVRDHLGAAIYEEYLQTQATINPGNSGGPLLDIDGRVIGINTLIKTRQGGGFSFYNANVGFAIPIKLAQKIGNLLITKGKVERPWIGVDIKSLSEATEFRNFIKGTGKGVLVMAIRPETPAYQSGLKPGDVIVAIDGAAVNTARELQKQVLDKQIGQTVHLAVVRDGKTFTVDVKTGLQPSLQPAVGRTPPPGSAEPNSYGLAVQPLTRELIEQFGLTEKSGLLVTDVEEESPSARAGIVPGMVITEVDGRKVATVQALKEGLKKSDPRRGALLQVLQDGIRSFVIVRTGRDAGEGGN